MAKVNIFSVSHKKETYFLCLDSCGIRKKGNPFLAEKGCPKILFAIKKISRNYIELR